MAAAGIIHAYYAAKKGEDDPQLARSQAEIVQFSVMRVLHPGTGVNGPSLT